MNDLNIGKTILTLRKDKNITQEQLANMVGVSAGAVSKWETGNSTPDISLLSPIARALDTSLDILLSFKKEISEEEVNNIKEKLTEIFLNEDYEKANNECNEYIREYPNSAYLKLSIATLIQMYGMMDAKDEDIYKKRMEHSLELLYKVVDSDEIKYRTLALFSIAHIEMALENYEKSEKAIKEISSSSIDPMVLYVSLLEKQNKQKELFMTAEGMLLQYLNQSGAMISILARQHKANNEYEEAKSFLMALHKIQESFQIGMGSAAYSLSNLYYEQDDMELAAKWFKKYVKAIIDAGYDYSNNPYFKHVKLQLGNEGQKIIRKKMFLDILENGKMDNLKGIKEYDEAIELLKKAAI